MDLNTVYYTLDENYNIHRKNVLQKNKDTSIVIPLNQAEIIETDKLYNNLDEVVIESLKYKCINNNSISKYKKKYPEAYFKFKEMFPELLL